MQATANKASKAENTHLLPGRLTVTIADDIGGFVGADTDTGVSEEVCRPFKEYQQIQIHKYTDIDIFEQIQIRRYIGNIFPQRPGNRYKSKQNHKTFSFAQDPVHSSQTMRCQDVFPGKKIPRDIQQILKDPKRYGQI